MKRLNDREMSNVPNEVLVKAYYKCMLIIVYMSNETFKDYSENNEDL